MAETTALMFEVGIIMLVAFMGAAIASRFRLSAIIGYIVAGILIGPHLRLDLWGVSYQGVITDSTLIQDMSRIGLVLLLFFVGLQFSIEKLRRTKQAAVVLALVNLGVGMFCGFVLGTYLGWPFIDTIFMAGVVAMSSSAITAKSLIDLRRLGNNETEFLLGMVILESFMAMFLLTLVNGLVIRSDAAPVSPLHLFVGVGLFIGFFAFLALLVIPRAAFLFEKIKSEELFVLFALGLVFLAAALAEAFRIPAIIGAFFIGMVFADTKLVTRFQAKLEPLRDAFVAVFFLSFGMMIDPAMLPVVLPMVLIAVPLIFLNDLFLTATLAYFIGFGGRAATAMGSSMLGRNEEAILYASVGTRAIQSNPALPKEYAGTLLTPFAGILCIIMSSVTPTIMNRSERIAGWLSRHLPKYLTFGGDLVKRTLRTFVLPAALPLFKHSRTFVLSLFSYVVLLGALAVTSGWMHVAVVAALPLGVYGVWWVALRTFELPVRHTNYGVVGTLASKGEIHSLVSGIVVGALASAGAVAAIWQFWWPATLVVLYAYFLFVVFSMKATYRSIVLGKGRRVEPSFLAKMKPLRNAWAPRVANGRK
jgi:CPA2 family monovalent cation:H+ antiporter-2